MKDHGRLPRRVHLIVALGSFIAALILATSESIVWLLAIGLMVCSGWLYIERLNEDKDDEG